MRVCVSVCGRVYECVRVSVCMRETVCEGVCVRVWGWEGQVARVTLPCLPLIIGGKGRRRISSLVMRRFQRFV